MYNRAYNRNINILFLYYMKGLSLKLQEKVFDFYIYISYFLIIISFLGTSFFKNTTYAGYLDKFVQVYIALFLIWRFNPYRKTRFSSLDRKIAFSAGFLLLTTSILETYIVSYIKSYTSHSYILKSFIGNMNLK